MLLWNFTSEAASSTINWHQIGLKKFLHLISLINLIENKSPQKAKIREIRC